jgi:hypothetical protein
MVYSIQEGMSCIKVSTSEDIASIVPLLFEQTSDSRDVSFLDLPQASLWGEGHARWKLSSGPPCTAYHAAQQGFFCT